MSRNSGQLGLGPMPLQESGNGLSTLPSGLPTLPTHAKKLGTTPLVDLAVRAFLRCGHNAQASAGLLQMGPSDFSKAFSINWPERNSAMKRWDALPFDVRREFVLLQMADYELSAAQDSEPVRVLRDLHRLLKAVGE